MNIMHRSFVSKAGPNEAGDSRDTAGFKYCVWTSASSPQCRGKAEPLILCPNRDNLTFTCRDLIRDFGKAMTTKMSPCAGHTRAVRRVHRPVLSPLFLEYVSNKFYILQ